MARAPQGWSKRFDEPIVLDHRTKLTTLGEAVEYLAKTVPKAEHNHPSVLTASDHLTRSAEQNYPMFFARMAWEPAPPQPRCMQDDFACLHYGLAWIRIRVFRIVAVLRWGHRGSGSRCPSTFLQTNPVGRVRRVGFCVSGNIPPTVIPWLNSVCGPGGKRCGRGLKLRRVC